MISNILRGMPHFKGKNAIARLLLKKTIMNLKDFTIQGKFDAIIKIPNAIENVGFNILINGVHEKETIEFIIKHLPKNKIFLDIGANIGSISVPVSMVRKDIQIICVEAAPWLFNYLKVNYQRNNISNVTLYNNAISKTDNEEVYFYSPPDLYGKGSMSPVFTKEGVLVKTITLDKITENFNAADIGLIKIDIEGFEYHAFTGGSKLLKSDNAPDILFEFVDWAEDRALGVKAGAAQALLMDFGYTLYPFTNKVGKEKLNSPITNGASMIFAKKISSIPHGL